MRKPLRELNEFCRWPWTDIRIVNDVTQARDFCALEVTFLNILKSSLALALAAVSVFLRRFQAPYQSTSRYEFALVISLAILAAIMPSVAFYNYVHATIGFRDPCARFNNTGSLWACALAACVLVLFLNIHQYGGEPTLGDVLVSMT